MATLESRMNRRGCPQTAFGRPSSGKWREYTALKYAWIRAHPNASSTEIDKASREIASQLGL